MTTNIYAPHRCIIDSWELLQLKLFIEQWQCIGDEEHYRPALRAVEIGSAFGGSLRFLAGLLGKHCALFSIDLPFETSDSSTDLAKAIKDLDDAGHMVKTIKANSHDVTTLMRLRVKLLEDLQLRAAMNCEWTVQRGFDMCDETWQTKVEGSVDLMLIDADHSIEGVARDVWLYSPLLAPGGLLIMHDVGKTINSSMPETQLHQLACASVFDYHSAGRKSVRWQADGEMGWGTGVIVWHKRKLTGQKPLASYEEPVNRP